MPSLVKIRIERGRDLPPMDRNVNAEASTDAYVEIRLQDQQQRTTTCRRSLNPIWNEEFRFDFLADTDLQDAPLELKCMDQDLYSSELIGIVYIDLNPLIMRTTQGQDKDLIISGWFPLFDTARGVRGSILVNVKLQFIGNENQFRESSAGIQFFTSSHLSSRCFYMQEIIGFVEEIVVEDDPENSWQDYFLKGNKTSNDNRLKVLYNMSAEVRRKLGKRAFDCGGNAVLGYNFHFDTEGAVGIVARAYGTACRLLKVEEGMSRVSISRVKYDSLTNHSSEWQRLIDSPSGSALVPRDLADRLGFRWTMRSSISSKVHDSLVLLQARHQNHSIAAVPLMPFALARDTSLNREAMTSSRHLKGTEYLGGDAWGNITHSAGENTLLYQVEVQLLTLKSFPPHVQVKFGGLVLARSVKYMVRGEGSRDRGEQDTLAEWWQELREEIKAHAKTLCCRYVVGYSEGCSIHGDVCILSAMGTAASLRGLTQSPALLNLPNSSPAESVAKTPTRAKESPSEHEPLSTPDPSSDPLPPAPRRISYSNADTVSSRRRSLSKEEQVVESGYRPSRRRVCTATHVPYNHTTAPFAFMRLVPCLLCKRKWVPESLLTTTEIPQSLPVKGNGRLLEAKVCRVRKGGAVAGEGEAVKISEVLPFLEYDLQRQITLKMKVMGYNAVFGYTCQIQVSNDIIIAVAHCTAVYLLSLPAPPSVQVVRNKESDSRVVSLYRDLDELSNVYKELNGGEQEATTAPSTSIRLPPRGILKAEERSRSSSSSSSSSSSDDESRGDDVSSLASPSSSSASSSSSTSSHSSSDSSSEEEPSLENKEEQQASHRVRTHSISSSSDRKVSSKSRTSDNKPPLKARKKVVYTDDRPPFVLEVDDETDVDLLSVLMDFLPPKGVQMVNLAKVPGAKEVLQGFGRYVTVLRRSQLVNKASAPYLSYVKDMGPGSVLSRLMHEVYVKLCYVVKGMAPCEILDVTQHINVIEDGQIEILLTAMVHNTLSPELLQHRSLRYHANSFPDSDAPSLSSVEYLQPDMSAVTLPLPAAHSSQWVVPRLEGGDSRGTGAAGMMASPRERVLTLGTRSLSFDHGRGRAPSNGSLDSLFTSLPLEGMKEEGEGGGDIRPSPRLETIEERSSVENPLTTPPYVPPPSGFLANSPPQFSSSLPPNINIPDFMRQTSLPNRRGSMSSTHLATSPPSSIALSQVLLTSLPSLPGTRIKRYLGPVQLHFLKDLWGVRGEGSLGSFVHVLLTEVNALARAHAAALGGNALLCYSLVPQEAGGRVSRSQGFTMFTVTADCVLLEFHIEGKDSVDNGDGKAN